MNKKIRICVIGCGGFANYFVPLFKAHPLVEKTAVCDLIPERAQEYSEKYGVPTVSSFEEVLSSDDFNAVAIITQRYTHGELVKRALEAGKNVYSAVPCGITVDEIKDIEALVRKTRLTYSMGETGYYRAQAIYCRDLFKKGVFGEFVYGEAQYNHDIRNMEKSFKRSGGDDWKKYAGFPPFFYPTHSTSMILGAMPGVRAVSVVAEGYESKTRKDIFGYGDTNFYGNPFANCSMLMKLSNGGVVRISENRCIGWKAPETYISKFYGSDAAYEFAVAKHYLETWSDRCDGSVDIKDVSDLLTPVSYHNDLKEKYEETLNEIANGGRFCEGAPIHPTTRLPREFDGMPNGHNGTHHFMVDDFCKAAYTGKLSPTNIWEAARFNLPGLVAHESALRGGIPLEVPYLGEPPKDWELLDPDGYYKN